MAAQIVRRDGEIYGTHSTFCPVCSSGNISQTVGTENCFSERGWYLPVTMQCNNIRCGGRDPETKLPYQWIEQRLFTKTK